MESDLASLAAESLPSEVALLDRHGVIAWENGAWRRAAAAVGDPLAGATPGRHLAGHLVSTSVPDAKNVEAAISSVLQGHQTLAVAHMPRSDGTRAWLLCIASVASRRGGAVVMRTRAHTSPAAAIAPSDPVDLRERVASLSSRERDVLRRMVRGLDNRQIAADLGISYTTVRSHTQAILEKLAARSRLEAVARAYRAGLGAER